MKGGMKPVTCTSHAHVYALVYQRVSSYSQQYNLHTYVNVLTHAGNHTRTHVCV